MLKGSWFHLLMELCPRRGNKPVHHPNVMEMSLCRCQLFHQVLQKSTNHCIRDATLYPKIPYLIMLQKAEKWSWTCIQNLNWMNTKIWAHLEDHPCPRLPSSVDIHKRIHELTCREMDTQTQNGHTMGSQYLLRLHTNVGRWLFFLKRSEIISLCYNVVCVTSVNELLSLHLQCRQCWVTEHSKSCRLLLGLPCSDVPPKSTIQVFLGVQNIQDPGETVKRWCIHSLSFL